MYKRQVYNDFCPQTLFLYGNYKENGTPDFGLFCWFSYIWLEDGLGVMACIDVYKRQLWECLCWAGWKSCLPICRGSDCGLCGRRMPPRYLP